MTTDDDSRGITCPKCGHPMRVDETKTQTTHGYRWLTVECLRCGYVAWRHVRVSDRQR